MLTAGWDKHLIASACYLDSLPVHHHICSLSVTERFSQSVDGLYWAVAARIAGNGLLAAVVLLICTRLRRIDIRVLWLVAAIRSAQLRPARAGVVRASVVGVTALGRGSRRRGKSRRPQTRRLTIAGGWLWWRLRKPIWGSSA